MFIYYYTTYQIVDNVITESTNRLDIFYNSDYLLVDTTNARSVGNLTIYPIKSTLNNEDISALYNIYIVCMNNNYYFIEMDNFDGSLFILYHVLGIIPCSNYIKCSLMDNTFKYYKGCIGYHTDNKPIFEVEDKDIHPQDTLAFILENNPNIQFYA